MGSCGFVEGPIGVQDVDRFDAILVSLPHLVVIGVVGWSDLDAARSQFRLGPFIGDQRDFPIDDGQLDHPTRCRHLGQLNQ